MIDYDDADDASFLGMITDGPLSLLFFILCLVLFYYAFMNDKECSTKSCPNNMKPKLSDNACVCVMEAK